MGKSNDNTISQLAILKQKINERGKILDATAASVKDTLNMLQSLVSIFDSGGEGLFIRNFPTTIQDQELIPVKENQLDKPIQVNESKHPRNHDNNYRGELNNTAEDEIAGQKNTASITNNDCRLSKQKFNRLLQEEIRHKVETEEHKKKVKIKLQRQEHKVCLRKGEMDKAHKLFDEMSEKFFKHSFFKNCKDVEILVKNVWHKESFKENKIVSVHHHEDFEDKMEELEGICKPFTVKMYQGAGGDTGATMDEDGPSTGTGSGSGPKIKEVVQDASMCKDETVEHKKKVKMKAIGALLQHHHPHCLDGQCELQRLTLEDCLRKEEMENSLKSFEEIPEKNKIQYLGSLWIFCYISSQVIESSPHVAIVRLLGELVEFSGSAKQFAGQNPGSLVKLSRLGKLGLSENELTGGYHGGESEFGVLGGSKSFFTSEELKEITNEFSKENFIGEGGFGCVHKWSLPYGQVVTDKQPQGSSGQGEREFMTDVVFISRVHHRHLVSLVGNCVSEKNRLFIYGFIPYNYLEHHLQDKGLLVLEWTKIVKIAFGAAMGLAYLREDCFPKIFHRDIKSKNISLNEVFEARVANIGLAKLNDTTWTHVSTRVIGTFGYLAPAYASSGKLSNRVDVFSFGVVLLKLVTGESVVGRAVKQHKKIEAAAAAEGRIRRALGDIENLVTVKGVDAKAQPQISCPITWSFCCQLANARTTVENKKHVCVKPKVQTQDMIEISPDTVTEIKKQDKAPVNKKKEAEEISSKKKSQTTLTSVLIDRSKATACGQAQKLKEQIFDIDAKEANNNLAGVGNVEDNYKFYRLVENESRPSYYIHTQTDINEKMRAILVDWLIEVHQKFEFSQETLYLTINGMDRFLSMKVVPRREFQLKKKNMVVTDLILTITQILKKYGGVEKFVVFFDNYYPSTCCKWRQGRNLCCSRDTWELGKVPTTIPVIIFSLIVL